MFKVNDILKYNVNKLEEDLRDIHDPIIWASLKQLAEQYRYEVLKVDAGGYRIKRINDGKINTFSVQETHLSLVLADDEPKTSDT